ncbi:hypothetical protein [Streptomyces sp. NPDC090026]|uniref:DUF7426 family protein n=1 Tax=Streptomyces sp. NPDC090026 TaxID=3365923 RepID=UPI00380E7656
MAATFDALDDFLDDYLELPVKGTDGVQRTYRIPSPPAEDGLRVEKITTMAARMLATGTEPDTTVLDDREELDLYRLCLSDVHDQLLAEVPWSRFKLAALTAMYWITADRETAAAFWKAGGDPSRLAPNRAARRQQRPGSSGSAAASTTRSRGSTSGTRAGSRRRGRGAPGPR